MDKQKFKLKYVELDNDENLYDGIDLKDIGIVEARYFKREGYDDNPDIFALPKEPTMDDVTNAATKILPGYNREMVPKMDNTEKKNQILKLDQVFFALWHHYRLASSIYHLLVASYAGRGNFFSESVNWKDSARDGNHATAVSLREVISARPEGFRMIGNTGTGKSDGAKICVSLFPQAIHHRMGTIEYVQIPIIMVTALVSNLTEVYRSIATRIDEILDTGSDHWNMVRTANLGKCAGYIKRWIKTYHIGLIIIDEIQFLKFDSSTSSFENIVSIAEETGCAFGIIGNPEAEEALKNMPRILSRTMNHVIEANVFGDEDNESFFMDALEDLWEYQWTDKEYELTGELRNAILKECAYNISLLKALFSKIQMYLVTHKGKKLTEDVIHSQAKGFEDLRNLIMVGDGVSEEELVNRLEGIYDDIRHEAVHDKKNKAAVKAHKEEHDDRDFVRKVNRIVDSIRCVTDYSETQIRRAVTTQATKDRALRKKPDSFLARAAIDSLNRMSKRAGRKLNLVSSARDERSLEEKAEEAVKEVMQNKIVM